MRQFPHIKRNHRSGNWVYFRRLPSSVRAEIGKEFFERSLRTADRKLIPAAWIEADRDFERIVSQATHARAERDSQPHPPAIKEKWFQTRVVLPAWDGDLAATKAPLNLSLERIVSAIKKWGEQEKYNRAQRLMNDSSYRDAESDFAEECKLVGAHRFAPSSHGIICIPMLALTNEILRNEGISIPPWHGTLYQVQMIVEEEYKSVLDAEGRWREYDFRDMPNSAPLQAAGEQIAPDGNAFVPLDILIDRYIATTRKPIKTASKIRMVGRYIEILHGQPLKANEVSKSLLIKLQTEALKIPARLSSKEKSNPFAASNRSENDSDDERARLTPQAIRSWFNLLSACFTWAVKADMMERNPTLGIKPIVKLTEERQRMPFDAHDIRLIFDENSYPRAGDEAKFWIPILALFTGARLNEIGQLHRRDIIIEGDPRVIITDETRVGESRKRLKNVNSRRLIPLHDAILKLGFLDYVRSSEEAQLFPSLPHNTIYEPTKAYSQWFGRYLRKIGILDPAKVFHSFRHTFKDECRRVGVEEEVHDSLTGHAGPSNRIGRSYGSGVPYEVLRKAIDKLEFASFNKNLVK